MRMHTRYEMHITPYKGKLQATLYDEYWDSHTTLWYGEGHPERATGIGRLPAPVKAWKALTHQIAALAPGWYAIEMPDGVYPFGDTFRLIRIPDRHLRYRDANRALV